MTDKLTPREIHINDQCDAEIRLHLAMGGTLAVIGAAELHAIRTLDDAKPGVCWHGAGVPRLQWSPRRPAVMQCAECVLASPPPASDLCDHCRWRAARAWSEFEVPRFQATRLGLPRLTVRLELCEECADLPPESDNAA